MDSYKEKILKNIKEVKEKIHAVEVKSKRSCGSVKLLAATKTVSPENINFALDNGIDLIGENKVQELLDKYEFIDKEKCEIHFIGTLQTNKVKYIIDKVSMIHSVDSLKLATEISKRAVAKNRVMDILIEVNVASEESKSGVLFDEVLPLAQELSKLEGVRVMGLMAVPPSQKKLLEMQNYDKNANIGENVYNYMEYFQKIQQLIIDISTKKLDNIYMSILSLGMSGDYEEAIEFGSTIVRIGSAIFGERKYL